MARKKQKNESREQLAATGLPEITVTSVLIDIDKVRPNKYNANVMTQDGMDRLIREIQESGFLRPIDVYPLQDGTFEIIDGYHRYLAAMTVGLAQIPCYVRSGVKWDDEDYRMIMSGRLNMLHGKLDPIKFAENYKRFLDKYGLDQIQDLMAITDQTAFRELKKGVMSSLAATGLPKETLKKAEKDIDKTKSAEEFGDVLNKIMTDYGEAVRGTDVVVVKFEGTNFAYFPVEADVWKTVVALGQYMNDNGINSSQALRTVLNGWQATLEASLSLPADAAEISFDESAES